MVPHNTWVSSAWPLPDTPAMPSISLLHTSSETFFKAGSPFVSRALTDTTRRTGTPPQLIFGTHYSKCFPPNHHVGQFAFRGITF